MTGGLEYDAATVWSKDVDPESLGATMASSSDWH
jgi:hypothetical protein